MGLRILHDEKNNQACFYCSTSDWAFGPVAYGENAIEDLESFSKFIKLDARTLSDKELESKWFEFRSHQQKMEKQHD